MAARAVAMAREAPEDPYAGLADAAQLSARRDAEGLEHADPTPEPAPADLQSDAQPADAAALAVSPTSSAISISFMGGCNILNRCQEAFHLGVHFLIDFSSIFAPNFDPQNLENHCFSLRKIYISRKSRFPDSFRKVIEKVIPKITFSIAELARATARLCNGDGLVA